MVSRKHEWKKRHCPTHGMTHYAPQYFHGKIQSWRCVKCRRECRGGRSGPTRVGDIGENIAKEIIPGLKRAKTGSRGDFVCPDGRLFDVKTACLTHLRPQTPNGEWSFDIRKNDKVDYFLLIALEVKQIWWIPGDEPIRGRPLRSRKTFSITPTRVADLDKYVVKI